MNEIKAGDKVRIVNIGNIYSTYTNWLFGSNKNVIDTDELGKFSFGRCPKENDDAVYTVQCISPHEDAYYDLLAYITSDCEGYIIGIEGLDYYEKTDSKTEEDIINNFFATCQLEDIVKRIDSKIAKGLCIKIMQENW